MREVTEQRRAEMIAALEQGERPYIVAQRYRMRIETLLQVVGWAPRLSDWPDLPANAFEDDPRACRPMPGKTIFGKAGAACLAA